MDFSFPCRPSRQYRAKRAIPKRAGDAKIGEYTVPHSPVEIPETPIVPREFRRIGMLTGMAVAAALMTACASRPDPAARTPSQAFAHTADTRLGQSMTAENQLTVHERTPACRPKPAAAIAAAG
ncbi:hypothetical protein RA280_38185 [Cupriavidus sp. CV2]|uniref:hypothetical protein n=1 Tax=Cupriavidus ulmosensis TaxID=3065913 RepID=UPI00296B54FA|nr:hypothetical protein [Cupriavidus sp. CV2]MDW3687465.1 hypothetical protein [Cupriavidus sp. CV2]